MIEVRRYQRPDGEVPLTDWLAGIRDARARAKLEIRFRRRVYLGRHGATLVILLCGGDKRTQDADIKRAKEYWSDWKRRNT